MSGGMQVAAIVLAAGRSSRMGAFKPLLPFGNGTVVEHVVAQLRAAGITAITAIIGHRAVDMRPLLDRLGVPAVLNSDVDRGMFESVRLGIAALPSSVDACVVWPADVPLIRATTVMRLLDAAAAERAAWSLHPTFRGVRGHPLVLARPLFDAILHAGGEGGLRTVIAAHPAHAHEVAVIDHGCLRDMDTPADYEALRAALAHAQVPDIEECEAIWDAAGVGAPVRRHCRAVADLAHEMAKQLRVAGSDIDLACVEAAALLHDIAKGQAHHAEAGATMVRDFGFPEIADMIAQHSDLVDWRGELDARTVVFLADKLVLGERRTTLGERFAPAFARFCDNAAACAGARRRLEQAEAVLCAVQARIASAAPGATEERRA